jgi:hypothetical protein
MTTTVKVATTKPLPQAPTVFVLDTIPGLPKSGVSFAASSVGYTSRVYGINASTGVIVTDTALVTGNVTDTVFIANAPGQYVPEISLIIVPIASAVNATQSANTSPAFYAPVYVAPSITAFTATVTYIDSMKVTGYVLVGNGGPALVQFQWFDSLGTLQYQSPNQVMFSSGPASSSRTGLKPGTKQTIKMIANTLGVGQDADTISAYTLPVPAASPSVDSTAKTKTTVDLYFSFLTNGTWNESKIDSFVIFENGVVVASVYQPIGNATNGSYAVHRTGRTPGTTYTYTGYVRNKFGIVTTIPVFNVTTIAPYPAATGTIGWDNSYATKVEWNDCMYNVPIGTAYYAMSFRKVSPGLTPWSTTPIGMQTGNGNFPVVTISGLEPSSLYEFKLMNYNEDSVYWESAVKTAQTTAAGQPQVNGITIDQLDQWSVSGTVVCEGNGTDAEEHHQLLLLSNGQTTPVETSATISVGNGAAVVPFSHALPSVGYYEERATVTEVGNINPYSVSKFFNNIGTGVAEVSFDDLRPMLLSRVWNLSDPSNPTLLGEGYTLEQVTEMFSGLIVALEPMNDYYRKTFGGKIYFPQK